MEILFRGFGLAGGSTFSTQSFRRPKSLTTRFCERKILRGSALWVGGCGRFRPVYRDLADQRVPEMSA
jgi:hypothetical protein